MKTDLRKLAMTVAFILILLITLAPGCKSPGGAAFPIEVHISFSEPPVLGKPVQVTATFNLVKDYFKKVVSNVDARVTLSEGLEFLNGNMERKGDFVLGETYTIVATIKSIKIGIWQIGADAFFPIGQGESQGGAKTLYVSVTENSATISDRPPIGSTHPPVPTSAPSPETNTVNGQSLPVQTQISFSEPLILNKAVQVTATFNIIEKYKQDLTGVTTRIILPEGFIKVDGDLEWKGDFVRGKEYSLKATIKATKTGIWKIEASAYSLNTFAGYALKYASVSQDSATIMDVRPLEMPTPVQTVPPPGYPVPSAPPAAPIKDAPPLEDKDKYIKPELKAKENLKLSSAQQLIQAEQLDFINPVRVYGGCWVTISNNIVGNRQDEDQPMVWGGVYVFDMSRTYILGSGTTGSGYDSQALIHHQKV